MDELRPKLGHVELCWKRMEAYWTNSDSSSNYNNNNNNDLLEKDGGTKNCIYKD